MPNWCSNTIEIQGTKEQINKFVFFLEEKNGKEWFDFFKPTPTELKEDGWYQWNTENWGTKWNCDAHDWEKSDNPNSDEASVTFWFDSAWAPPVALYEYIESNTQLSITASYHEEGMTFVGEFRDGSDDYYEYTDLESLEDIPEHIVEEWNLVELLEDREEDEDE